MRVVHLCTSDSKGGAARSALRLHHGLVSLGVDSHLLVAHKGSTLPNTHRLERRIARLSFWLGGKAAQMWMRYKPGSKSTFFSLDLMPDAIITELKALKPDIVNLHWVNNGFMRLETVGRLPRPIVWTCHDMWPFTGGCHYSGECRKYETICGECPQLASTSMHDLAWRVWERKDRTWRGAVTQAVTPSRWLAGCVKASSLFRGVPVKVIPYGLDTDVFAPRDRVAARRRFKIPDEMNVVLFGADSGAANPRKGFDLLTSALRCLPTAIQQKLTLAVFGSDRHLSIDGLCAEIRPLGTFSEDAALADAYSAADLFVAPSREDNLPNTVLESLACGTPALAFNVGGMPDMIDHRETGYLATPFSEKDLGAGLIWLLGSAGPRMRDLCRQRSLERYPLRAQAELYRGLYASLHAGAP